MNKKPFIESLLIGKVQQLANTDFKSAINKFSVDTPQQLTKFGLINDTQADLYFHGGVDKAIHQYPREHYIFWKENFKNPIFENLGAFRENISTWGMTEKNVCIGDRYIAGSCILEVSQARQPCWKLNYHFNFPDMAKTVQGTLKTGWYYRVIQTGTLKKGDTLELIERPFPEWSLYRLLTILYKSTLDFDILKESVNLYSLAESWKQLFRKRLETKMVENWHNRLYKL